MRAAAASTVPEAEVVAPRDLPRAIEGAVLACELFDALPVHRLRRRDGRLLEVRVGSDGEGGLVEVEGEVCPAARVLAERYRAAALEGFEAEVCSAAEEVLDGVGELLGRGFAVIVDYGHHAEALYGPAHPRGTLLAYSRHAAHEGVLDRPGEQDLTAHVNFTQLEDGARSRGLVPLGTTSQDRFLIANGILERFEGTGAEWSSPRRIQDRLDAMQLIHPGAMGRRFQVSIWSRGVSPEPPLRGLQSPMAPPGGAGYSPPR
jgi:SAM-dependent MidA family methyltransferase